jgi:hypothetical protein
LYGTLFMVVPIAFLRGEEFAVLACEHFTLSSNHAWALRAHFFMLVPIAFLRGAEFAVLATEHFTPSSFHPWALTAHFFMLGHHLFARGAEFAVLVCDHFTLSSNHARALRAHFFMLVLMCDFLVTVPALDPLSCPGDLVHPSAWLSLPFLHRPTLHSHPRESKREK